MWKQVVFVNAVVVVGAVRQRAGVGVAAAVDNQMEAAKSGRERYSTPIKKILSLICPKRSLTSPATATANHGSEHPSAPNELETTNGPMRKTGVVNAD